jgi:hypothetical protein
MLYPEMLRRDDLTLSTQRDMTLSVSWFVVGGCFDTVRTIGRRWYEMTSRVRGIDLVAGGTNRFRAYDLVDDMQDGL